MSCTPLLSSSTNQKMNQFGAVYSNGVMSPPPSKQASTQSHGSNGNGMYAFPQSRTSSVRSSSQNQLAEYHDGYQVASPQVIPQSPYPVPTPRNTLIEDPEYQEFLEHKRRKMLAQMPQQQQQSQPPPFFQQQQQEAQQWAHQQQSQLQQLQQQQRSPHSSPPFPLPAQIQRASYSTYSSMDDADQRYQQQYQQGFPQQFAVPQQPYIHAVRPGHTYGKITAKGKAKIMLGNGVSGKATGMEKSHNYGEVEMDEDVDVIQGDYGAAEISSFFHRPPPPPQDPNVVGPSR